MTGPEVPPAAVELWRELAGASDVLAPGTRRIVTGSRGLCPQGWVGVVGLGDAVVVERGAATDAAVATLLELPDPTDPDQVREALPVAEHLGPAELAYLPEGRRSLALVAVPDGAEVTTLDAHEVAPFLAELPPDEVGESSVADLPEITALVWRGRVAGVGGYHRWPKDVAHLGLLVHPEVRGRGVGSALGAAIAAGALADGLTPQWRAAVWNTASARVAERLGFRRCGRQLSFVLRG